MKLTIRYTAGDPPRERVEVHEIPGVPPALEIDVPKLEIRATLKEWPTAEGMRIQRRTIYLQPECEKETHKAFCGMNPPETAKSPYEFIRFVAPPKRPTLWQRIKRFIPFLCLAFVLAGCDYSSNIPTASDFDTGPTTWVCWNYTVPLADTTMYTTQDSTKLCDDGTSPILFEATWISTDDWCTSMPETVVGGLKGIRRRFACRKQNVMHETQRKVVEG